MLCLNPTGKDDGRVWCYPLRGGAQPLTLLHVYTIFDKGTPWYPFHIPTCSLEIFIPLTAVSAFSFKYE